LIFNTKFIFVVLPNLVTLITGQIKKIPTVHTIDSIKIDVYSREHLPPHFHALYAEHEILIVIKTLGTYAGSLPNRQHKTVLEWAKDEKIKALLLVFFTTLNPNVR